GEFVLILRLMRLLGLLLRNARLNAKRRKTMRSDVEPQRSRVIVTPPDRQRATGAHFFNQPVAQELADPVLWRKRHKLFDGPVPTSLADRAALRHRPPDPLEVPIRSVAAVQPYNRPLRVDNAQSIQRAARPSGRRLPAPSTCRH